MAKPIKMPKLSDEMTEGRIAEWQKEVGDEVKAGDVLAQVETEKATLDVEAFDAGVLIGIAVKAGESAPVGQPIAWIGARGEKVPEAAAAEGREDAAKEARAGGEIAHRSTQAGAETAAKVPVAPPEPPPPGPSRRARRARRWAGPPAPSRPPSPRCR